LYTIINILNKKNVKCDEKVNNDNNLNIDGVTVTFMSLRYFSIPRCRIQIFNEAKAIDV
jgi:hypothetical protein